MESKASFGISVQGGYCNVTVHTNDGIEAGFTVNDHRQIDGTIQIEVRGTDRCEIVVRKMDAPSTGTRAAEAETIYHREGRTARDNLVFIEPVT